MSNQLAKVYRCAKCSAQVIITKAGSGSIKCCGEEMKQK